jgi:hypothetical protein
MQAATDTGRAEAVKPTDPSSLFTKTQTLQRLPARARSAPAPLFSPCKASLQRLPVAVRGVRRHAKGTLYLLPWRHEATGIGQVVACVQVHRSGWHRLLRLRCCAHPRDRLALGFHPSLLHPSSPVATLYLARSSYIATTRAESPSGGRQ